MTGRLRGTAPPAYTGRPREALYVTRTPSGHFAIGVGRVTIRPGPVPFVGDVVADLGRILNVPGGADLLAAGDRLGHKVVIALPERPATPRNGWTVPDNIQAATAAGMACGPAGEAGALHTGTGTGCGSAIFYDPADWDETGGRAGLRRHEILMMLLQLANLNAAGRNGFASLGPAPLLSALPPAGALRLHCSPTRFDGKLIFPYTLQNAGAVDVFVMDAWPGAATQIVDQVSVVAGSGGDVFVGRFVPPWPSDRHVARTAVPLGRRLAAGATLDGCLNVPEPLAEANPHLPDARSEPGGAIAVSGVVVRIGYWPADLVGLDAVVADRDAVLYEMAPAAAREAFYVTQRFPTHGLQIRKRASVVPPGGWIRNAQPEMAIAEGDRTEIVSSRARSR